MGTLAKTVTKSTLKAGTASAIKKVPIVGFFFGIGLAITRLVAGDPTGAFLEAASGLVSVIPGTGTVGSLAIDATIHGRDLARNVINRRH